MLRPGRVGGSGPSGSVVIPTDGPDGWYRPVTADHWNALAALYPGVVIKPDVLFALQETSGSIVPAIDGLSVGSWPVLGAGNLYSQPVTGWTAGHVGSDETAGTGVGWLAPSNGALDISVDESYAVMGYMSIGAPSTTRRFHQIQGNNNYQQNKINGAMASRHGGVNGPDTNPVYLSIDSVSQIGWQRRGDQSFNGGFTHLEPMVQGTYDGAAYTSASRALGAPSTAVDIPAFRANLYAIWKGANAQFDMRAMFAALRRVPGIPHFQDMSAAVASTTSAALTNPTHITNDVLFLVAEGPDSATLSLSVPGNFTLVSGFPVTAGSAGAGSRLYVWWCRAASSSETSPTVDTSTNHVIARIISFRGCRTTGDPWDALSTDVESSSTTACAIPGTSPSVISTLAFGIGTSAVDSAATQHSGATNPDLIHNRIVGSSYTTSGHGGGFALFLGERRAATAFGATTSTLANASVQARACFALRS